MKHATYFTVNNKKNYNVITETGKNWEILFKQCKQSLFTNTFIVFTP